MNDHEKDAVATFLSQVVKAVKCIMDLASKLWRKIKECYDIAVSRVIDLEKERPVTIPLYKLNKELKVKTLTLNECQEEYREAVGQMERMYDDRAQLLAERNKTLFEVAEEIKRLKQGDQAELLYALERYAEPDFYCILNDREVFEVHGPEDIRPIGSLAREKLSSVSKT